MNAHYVTKHFTESADVYRLGSTTNGWNGSSKAMSKNSTIYGRFVYGEGDKGSANLKDEAQYPSGYYTFSASDVTNKDELQTATDRFKIISVQPVRNTLDVTMYKKVVLRWYANVQS